MTDSELKSLIDCLDAQRFTVVRNLNGWTWVVAVGVVCEIIFIIWEHCEDFGDWKYAHTHFKIRFPSRPRRIKLLLEILSVALVVAGIVGELTAEAKLGELDWDIQDANNRRVALLQKESEKEQLARVKIEADVAWRTLSKEQQAIIPASLRNCSGLKVRLLYLGGAPEALLFAKDIAAALSAKCNVAPVEAYSLFGGFGGGVTEVHPLTGVNVSTSKDPSSRNAGKAIQRDLCAMGFDAAITDRLAGSDFNIDVLVMARPDSAQGRTKLTINTTGLKKTCNASP